MCKGFYNPPCCTLFFSSLLDPTYLPLFATCSFTCPPVFCLLSTDFQSSSLQSTPPPLQALLHPLSPQRRLQSVRQHCKWEGQIPDVIPPWSHVSLLTDFSATPDFLMQNHSSSLGTQSFAEWWLSLNFSINTFLHCWLGACSLSHFPPFLSQCVCEEGLIAYRFLSGTLGCPHLITYLQFLKLDSSTHFLLLVK